MKLPHLWGKNSREFQKHVEANKKDRVVMKEKVRLYIFDIFRIFYQLLFEFEETAEYAEKDYFWRALKSG